MNLRNTVTGIFMLFSLASVGGCVALVLATLEYQTASGTYETGKSADIVATEAVKLRTEIEARELSKFSRVMYKYQIAVSSGTNAFKTRIDVTVGHIGEWDPAAVEPPSKKLGLFVDSLGVRIGGRLVLVPETPDLRNSSAGRSQ